MRESNFLYGQVVIGRGEWLETEKRSRVDVRGKCFIQGGEVLALLSRAVGTPGHGWALGSLGGDLWSPFQPKPFYEF